MAYTPIYAKFSLPNNQTRHAHARPNTHTQHAHLLAQPLHLRQQRRQLPRARRPQRMAQRNRPSLQIHLLLVDAQLPHAVQRLARKRLVDLPDLHVVRRNARVVEEFRDRDRGADAHLVGVATDDLRAGPLSRDGGCEAQVCGCGAAHHEGGGGAVGDLGAVPGGAGAVGAEGGFEFSEGLEGRFGADAVVFGDGDLFFGDVGGVFEINPAGCDGDDFLVEEAVALGLGGFLVRPRGEGVLLGARDPVAGGDVLGCESHGHDAVAGVFVGGVFERGPQDGGDGAGTVVAGHGFHAGADTDVDGADGDGVRDGGDGCEAGGALPVDGVEGCGGGEAGVVLGHAASFRAAEFLEDVADRDILDEGGVEVGVLGQGCFEDDGEKFFGVGVFEAALFGAGDWGAEGSEEDNVMRVLLEDVLEAFLNEASHTDDMGPPPTCGL